MISSRALVLLWGSGRHLCVCLASFVSLALAFSGFLGVLFLVCCGVLVV